MIQINDEINNDDDDFAILNFLALDWLRLNSWNSFIHLAS